MQPRGAQRHLAVQEEQRLFQLGLEVEAEGFPPAAAATGGGVLLLLEHHGVILGADVLDEHVVRRHAGVGVGRHEARHDGESQRRVAVCRRELKQGEE